MDLEISAAAALDSPSERGNWSTGCFQKWRILVKISLINNLGCDSNLFNRTRKAERNRLGVVCSSLNQGFAQICKWGVPPRCGDGDNPSEIRAGSAQGSGCKRNLKISPQVLGQDQNEVTQRGHQHRAADYPPELRVGSGFPWEKQSLEQESW